MATNTVWSFTGWARTDLDEILGVNSWKKGMLISTTVYPPHFLITKCKWPNSAV